MKDVWLTLERHRPSSRLGTTSGTITRYARGIHEQRDKELAESFTDDVVRQTQPWTQRPLVGKVLARKAFRNYCQAFQHP